MIAHNYLEDQKRSMGSPTGPRLFMDECSEFAADLVKNSDSVLLIGDFRQLVQRPTLNGGNTLDLVLTRGVDTSHLVAVYLKLKYTYRYTSVLSDRFLLALHVVVSCPCDDHQASPTAVVVSTLQLRDKLPSSLAPLSNFRGCVDRFTDDFNTALPAAIHSLLLFNSKLQKDLRHGLMKNLTPSKLQ